MLQTASRDRSGRIKRTCTFLQDSVTHIVIPLGNLTLDDWNKLIRRSFKLTRNDFSDLQVTLLFKQLNNGDTSGSIAREALVDFFTDEKKRKLARKQSLMELQSQIKTGRGNALDETLAQSARALENVIIEEEEEEEEEDEMAELEEKDSGQNVFESWSLIPEEESEFDTSTHEGKTALQMAVMAAAIQKYNEEIELARKENTLLLKILDENRHQKQASAEPETAR